MITIVQDHEDISFPFANFSPIPSSLLPSPLTFPLPSPHPSLPFHYCLHLLLHFKSSLDNDDGSSFYHDHDSFYVYGGEFIVLRVIPQYDTRTNFSLLTDTS